MKVKGNIATVMCTAGLGGMLFDLGGTIINPAIPYLEALKAFSTAQLAHLTSAVVLSAAFAGLVAGFLAERIGRRRTMILAAAVACVACLPICLGGGDYRLFYLGRVLQGVAAGLLGVVVPMYLAEVLPPDLRGRGAGLFQFMDVIGILLCSLVGLCAVMHFGPADAAATSAAAKESAWRAIFWTSAIPALIFLLGAFILDESPAYQSAAAKKSPTAVHLHLSPSPEFSTSPLLSRRYILPFAIALAVLVCNQATGCNAIQYFALKLFQDAGLGNQVASYANVSLWAVMLAMTAVGALLVDRCGRKVLLASGTAAMLIADLAAGTVFLALQKGWLQPSVFSGWLAVAAIALFIAGFSAGPGVVVWLALSELMPARIREKGMAVGLFLNMLVAWLVSDVFLVWVESSGYATVLFALAAAALVYLLVALFVLPETKGKTLEEIESLFAG